MKIQNQLQMAEQLSSKGLENAKSQVQQPKEEGQQISRVGRVQGGVFCWLVVTLSLGAVPILNLVLYFFQPSGLAASGLSTTPIFNLGQVHDYKLFYMMMGLYTLVGSILLIYSWQFGNLKLRLKLIFMVDPLLLAMLAADVCYSGLHIYTFSTVYTANEATFMLKSHIIMHWQDFVIIALYSLVNLIVVGTIKILITHLSWKHWQIILLKIVIGGTSLLYFIMGVAYLFGKDNLNQAVQNFVDTYAQLVIELFQDPTSKYFAYIPYFQNYNSSLKEQTLFIANITVIYLISNFTFYFEIIQKISEFDGTAELKTHYSFIEESQLIVQPKN